MIDCSFFFDPGVPQGAPGFISPVRKSPDRVHRADRQFACNSVCTDKPTRSERRLTEHLPLARIALQAWVQAVIDADSTGS